MIKHAPAPFYPLTLQFNQPHSVYRETTCHMVAIVPCHWILLTAHSQAWIVFDGLSSSSLLFFFLFSNRAITTVNKHRNRHMHSLSWLLCWCISVIYPPRPGWWSRDWKICHGIAVHLPTTPFAQPTRVLKMVNVYFIIIRGKQYGWGHASVVVLTMHSGWWCLNIISYGGKGFEPVFCNLKFDSFIIIVWRRN